MTRPSAAIRDQSSTIRDEHHESVFIGGGIGSLAGAAFLIRDGGIEGSDITIFEKHLPLGRSLDGARLVDGSYSLRGGRMLTTDHYECTWDLLSTIPGSTAEKAFA